LFESLEELNPDSPNNKNQLKMIGLPGVGDVLFGLGIVEPNRKGLLVVWPDPLI
jgi:hypothetical protein